MTQIALGTTWHNSETLLQFFLSSDYCRESKTQLIMEYLAGTYGTTQLK